MQDATHGPFHATERIFFCPLKQRGCKCERREKCTWGSCVSWPHFQNGPGRLQGRHRCSFHCKPFLASSRMTQLLRRWGGGGGRRVRRLSGNHAYWDKACWWKPNRKTNAATFQSGSLQQADKRCNPTAFHQVKACLNISFESLKKKLYLQMSKNWRIYGWCTWDVCRGRRKSVMAGHARKTPTQKSSARGVSLRLQIFFFNLHLRWMPRVFGRKHGLPSAPQEGNNQTAYSPGSGGGGFSPLHPWPHRRPAVAFSPHATPQRCGPCNLEHESVAAVTEEGEPHPHWRRRGGNKHNKTSIS